MKTTKLKIFFATLMLIGSAAAQARNIYVSPSGSNMNDGSIDAPYRTISKAAYVAIAGDSVIIREGVYRENVSPANGGTTPARRITYIAAEGEKVELKGSEEISGWKKVSGNVWRAVVDNSIFGNFNILSQDLQSRDRLANDEEESGAPSRPSIAHVLNKECTLSFRDRIVTDERCDIVENLHEIEFVINRQMAGKEITHRYLCTESEGNDKMRLEFPKHIDEAFINGS